jgi:hypothetical protein
VRYGTSEKPYRTAPFGALSMILILQCFFDRGSMIDIDQ